MACVPRNLDRTQADAIRIFDRCYSCPMRAPVPGKDGWRTRLRSRGGNQSCGFHLAAIDRQQMRGTDPAPAFRHCTSIYSVSFISTDSPNVISSRPCAVCSNFPAVAAIGCNYSRPPPSERRRANHRERLFEIRGWMADWAGRAHVAMRIIEVFVIAHLLPVDDPLLCEFVCNRQYLPPSLV